VTIRAWARVQRGALLVGLAGVLIGGFGAAMFAGVASGRLILVETAVPGTLDERDFVIADLRARLSREKRRVRAYRRASRHLRVQVRQLGREVRREWDYPTLIGIAATTYSVSQSTLERKARCESVNFTDFYNESSSASNVFQFLPSTWRTTPYARFSIFNPFAAVLAGAWMHREGRGGEWVCK
jgi:hypothetical protein